LGSFGNCGTHARRCDGELSLPSLFARLVDEGVARGDAAVVATTGGEMLLATLLVLALQVASGLFSSRFSSRFGMHVRAEVFRRIVRLPFGEYRRFGAATLLTRATTTWGSFNRPSTLGCAPSFGRPSPPPCDSSSPFV